MDDAAYNKQKRRLQILAEKWIGPLGLKWWKVDIVYSREPIPSSAGEGWNCIGKASVRWEYLDAKITFDMQAIEGMDDDRLEQLFVHECCHILVHEMREWCQSEGLGTDAMAAAMKHEERVVCQLTSAFLWTHKAGAGKLAGHKVKMPRRKK